MAIADHSAVVQQVTPVLEMPDQAEVLALDPMSFNRDQLDEDGADYYHGFRVLGRTGPLPVEDVAAVGPRALESIAIWGDWRCVFVPRHGLRVRRGDDGVNLVICFECGEVIVYPRPPFAGRIGYSRASKDQLNALLARAGVKPAD